MSIAVSAVELTKRFGSNVVLEDLHIEIPPGQFVAVVGKSGCGKSTFLRSIAGLERSDGGAVELDGRPVSTIDPRVRVMFQDDRLLPWQTTIDNIALVAGDREQARAGLTDVGLADKADVWPSMLSGGQRQRVALARALASSPEVVLLDEPLGALDAFTRVEMQRLVERVWSEHAFTAVLVTHDVGEAVALADRVVVLAEGRIALDVAIDLPRPRERDESFYSYEQTIFNRVIH